MPTWSCRIVVNLCIRNLWSKWVFISWKKRGRLEYWMSTKTTREKTNTNKMENAPTATNLLTVTRKIIMSHNVES